MITLAEAIGRVSAAQAASAKPLGIVLAGHNGSGKSTMWRQHLSPYLQIPLVNADRMMLSVLPEPDNGMLPVWASRIRDENQAWMQVAQKGVESFVAHAISRKVPFAMETVFSYWKINDDGSISSKIDLIKQMQDAGYFVLLCFVGLTNSTLSIARVATRVANKGHSVSTEKLIERFPRTQKAIEAAAHIADAAILVDNSLSETHAFSVCRIQLGAEEIFDLRRSTMPPAAAIREWLEVVSPTS
jgi:predicted ABC-type ATPase